MAAGVVESDLAQPLVAAAVAADRLGVLDQAGTQPRREQVPSRQQPVGADRLLGAGHEIIHDRIGELAVLAGLLDAPA
jgi:hypothetical protein